MKCSGFTGLGDAKRWRWLFLKCPAPARAICWPRAGSALRRLRPGRKARAVGRLSTGHRAAWHRYLRRGRWPASNGFRWLGAGLRRGRPHHDAAVWSVELFPWGWEVTTQLSSISPDHLSPPPPLRIRCGWVVPGRVTSRICPLSAGAGATWPSGAMPARAGLWVGTWPRRCPPNSCSTRWNKL